MSEQQYNTLELRHEAGTNVTIITFTQPEFETVTKHVDNDLYKIHQAIVGGTFILDFSSVEVFADKACALVHEFVEEADGETLICGLKPLFVEILDPEGETFHIFETQALALAAAAA